MRILIADDEKGLGRLFKLTFRIKMPESLIDVVASGDEAVDAFRRGIYDVVLLDVSMPEKDGYHACLEIQEICTQETLKMPFVIFYSGYGVPEDIEKLLEDKSHYAFLHKPISSEQLIAAIEAIYEK